MFTLRAVCVFLAILVVLTVLESGANGGRRGSHRGGHSGGHRRRHGGLGGRSKKGGGDGHGHHRKDSEKKCKPDKCKVSYLPCSASCGPGTQTPRIVQNKKHCDRCGIVPQPRACNLRCCPIDCAWNAWGAYGSCSASCGGGSQSRSRSKSRSASCGGSCSGSSASSRPCNSQSCPVDCVWGSWGAFSGCTATCGGGTQDRSRRVAVHEQNGGQACSGSSISSQECNTQPCPVDCVWGPWGEFSGCSTTCGGGTQDKSRRIAVNEQNGGQACSGVSTFSQECNTQPCPIDCVWGPWGEFSSCSVTCGGGTHDRSRQIAVNEQNGEQGCSGASVSSQECNAQPCPINCVWGNWSEFSRCSSSCGGGMQNRSRSVGVEELYGGLPCAGSSSSSQECNTQPCPVDCVWGEWGAFAACNASCGGGSQNRSRLVLVEASHGGAPCVGKSNEFQVCNTDLCPVDCVWGNWSEFSSCSVSCGGGDRRRSRTVLVEPLYGGAPCTGNFNEYQTCNTDPCPVDCVWNEWGTFSTCNVTCGGGMKFRSRTVLVKPLYGGTPCTGNFNEYQACNTDPCPVDCVWGNWSVFSICNATCGGGRQIRSRGVLVPASHGGAACLGQAFESRACNSDPCPVDCQYTDWSEFSACTVTCGGGTQTRTRSIAVPAQFGGAPCDGVVSITRDCANFLCPVDCVWGSWGEFGNCSASCGGGSRFKTRQIAQPASGGGSDCVGSAQLRLACNTQCCPVNCQFNTWAEWGACSRSCGTGYQSRERSVGIAESCGGQPCNLDLVAESRTCNEFCCPVDCIWGNWMEWSGCDVTCGTGEQARHRTVTTPSSCNGAPCNGSGTEKQHCNTQQCPVLASVCETMMIECPPGLACVDINISPGYECQCPLGFTLVNEVCEDINECEINENDCDVNATCENIQGSYECYCNHGFTGNGINCVESP